MTVIRGLDPRPSDADLLRRAAAKLGRRPIAAPAVVPAVPLVALPFRLTLPWSLLVSDNAKFVPRSPGVLTSEYRAAKREIAARAAAACRGATPRAEPLQLEAHVWVPREGAIDVVNRAKIVHDGLEKSVYANDRWLYHVRWIRAGVDVDAPRIELTIRSLL